MNKNNDIFSDTITTITNLLSDDMIDYEGLRRKVEDEMTKQQIEKKYGSDIQQMPSGLWWIRLEDGRVIKLTKRENVIKKLIELEKSNDDSVTEYTLQTFWNMYWEHRKLAKSAGTARIDKRHYMRYISSSTLATIPFSKITPTDIDTWVNDCFEINPTMTSKYFDNVIGVLSQMFQYAMKCKFISFNPADDIDVHKDNFTPAKIHYDEDDFFLHDEESAVKVRAYADAKTTKCALPLGIPLLFQTGVRDGELCALHWRDIEGQYLHVQSEIVEKMDENGNFDGYRWVDHCKSKAGNRRIPLNSEAKEIFSEVKKLNLASGLPIGQDDFIFLRVRKGNIEFCTNRCFESRLKKYCRQAKMDVLKSQHDIRRTFATNLYYIGMPIKNISQIMGHESIEQTEQYIKCKPLDDVFDFMEQLANRNKIGTDGTDSSDIKKIGNA